jgi:hypothetical protein
MSRMWGTRKDSDGDEARDPQVASALAPVDPAHADPSYWIRFQSRVMQSAAPELARRRLMADLGVADVVTGWARALVPTAMLAAAIAMLILMRNAPTVDLADSMTVEDILTAGIETQTIPEVLAQVEASATAFAAERF